MRRILATRGVSLVAAAVMGAMFWLVPAAAQAHSLDSSTISTHVSEDGLEATVSLPLETLDEALGTTYAQSLSSDDTADIIDYIDEHLAVAAADGTEWATSFENAEIETVEGIESFTVDVVVDTAGQTPDDFELTYDAIIEAVSDHEAVVVLTDAAGDVSTPGVLTSGDSTLEITDAAPGVDAVATGAADMVGYGFHHVLEGADHLLFLTTLLLVAPLIAVRGRWQARTAVAPTTRRVLVIVTSFTLGHSLTLIAASLGWVSLPATPVEVLVAVSVAVAAVHAVRPLVAHGETLIAGAFGLVHGLAFAGILDDLGVQGSTSLSALLAFNVGVELAQLTATALVFPSLFVMARTRAYPAVRIGIAAIAFTAATGWAGDRLGLWVSPFTGAEDALIAHPWPVVATLAAVALVCFVVEHRQPQPSRTLSGPMRLEKPLA